MLQPQHEIKFEFFDAATGEPKIHFELRKTGNHLTVSACGLLASRREVRQVVEAINHDLAADAEFVHPDGRAKRIEPSLSPDVAKEIEFILNLVFGTPVPKVHICDQQLG